MVFSTASSVSTCSAPQTFPFSVRIGLLFIVEAAGLSALAIVCLLIYIVVRRSFRSTWIVQF